MILVNCRCGGNKGVGDSMTVDTTGSSVVDYVVSTPIIMGQFKNVKICSKLPESDPLPVIFSLKCNTEAKPESDENIK